MAQGVDHAVVFEGIATVSVVAGVEHDAYMVIKSEVIGDTIRWFGTFGWMGTGPKTFLTPIVADITLSDGRDCQVKVTGEHEGTWEFLGLGMPPGFQAIRTETVTVDLKSSTPAWRRYLSRLLGFASIVLMFSAIWVPSDLQWRIIATGTLAMFLAIGFAPTARKLPEVPSDCPHQ